MDHTIRIWDVNASREVKRIGPTRYSVDSAALAQDQQFLAASALGEGVDLWDARSGQCLRTIPQEGARTRKIAWAPADRKLAWGSGTGIWLWDIDNAEPLHLHPRDAHGLVYDLAWSPNGRWFAVACERKTVQLWSADIRQMLKPLEGGHTREVRSVAWSPDGQWLCSGSLDQTICVWHPDVDRPVRRLNTNLRSVLALSVSCDGSLLAAQSYTEISLWRTDNWKHVGTMSVPHALAPALAFHPTQSLLATRGEQETINIWHFDLPAIFANAPFKRPPPRSTLSSAIEPADTMSLNQTKALPKIDPAVAAQLEEWWRILEHKKAIKAFDVFISYSARDRWVKSWLVPHLEKRGICCYVDFRVGGFRPREIEYAVKHCPKTLLVLSPAWLVDEWGNFASLLAQSQDPSALDRRLLPLLYKSCPSLPLRLRYLEYADFQNSHTRLRELERLIAAINTI